MHESFSSTRLDWLFRKIWFKRNWKWVYTVQLVRKIKIWNFEDIWKRHFLFSLIILRFWKCYMNIMNTGVSILLLNSWSTKKVIITKIRCMSVFETIWVFWLPVEDPLYTISEDIGVFYLINSFNLLNLMKSVNLEHERQ